MLTNTINKIEYHIAKLASRNEAVFVDRAAWGLYALLSIWKVAGKIQRIAIPSFSCQSPLAATLLAGWDPEFCDVDPSSGIVSNSEWLRVVNKGVDAVLFVHLFGNVGDAASIADVCRSKGIYFVEDAAQSFGGMWESNPCGSFGDAAIISFGHTKLIDVGQGGMVLTNDHMLATAVRNFKADHSLMHTINAPIIAKRFQEMFYAARQKLGTSPELARESFKGLIHFYKPLILSISKQDISEKVLECLEKIDSAIQDRREKNDMYMDMLCKTAMVPLEMSSASVPWRSTFRLPGIGWADQQAISEAVRLEGVDISNWYIPSHWLMGGTFYSANKLESTERLSKEIFQLWIDQNTDKEEVKRAATVLTLKLKEIGYA
ncbi:DegT/DnrJ/EryC1/StrS family aminotransferase [Candidatus Methylopumilus planktonicus]|uniref:DegT/DnrJ/EryC1/StrS family aminotransferase n=1 Tax=Candidatus Methylopumilus planktonicus TaxID=1581557 RepID=UPI003BEECD1A